MKAKLINVSSKLFLCVIVANLFSQMTPAFSSETVIGNSVPVTSQAQKTIEQRGRPGEFVPIISWTSSGITSWAVLLCLHGMGLHKEVYEPFARQMARVGVKTYAIDFRGFGSWKNAPYGKTLDLKASLSDIENVVKIIRQENPTLPVVLLGESMGGAVVIQKAALSSGLVDGVIACVPSGMRYSKRSDQIKTAIGLLNGASKPINIAPHFLKRVTEDAGLQEQWMNDPKVRLLLSPNELISFQHFMNQTGSLATKLRDIPVLVLQGGQDKLIKEAGTADLFHKIASVDKDLIVLGTSEHLIFEQGQFDEESVSAISGWLLKHVVASFAVARDKTAGKNSFSADLADALLKKDSALIKFDPVVQENVIGHFFLGQGYLRLGDKDKARKNFEEVIKNAPESFLSSEARVLLLTALRNDQNANQIDAKQLDKVELNFVTPKTAMDNPLPTFITTYTKWLSKRDDIERLFAQLQLRYNGQLNLVKLDADDPANKALINRFNVVCVPTYVFLNGQNIVVDKRVGYTDAKDIMPGIIKILPTDSLSAN